MTLKGYLINHREVDPIHGCWLFTGSTDTGGYGQFRWEGKHITAHRAAYKEWVKEPTHDVLHKIECPHKHCFNPEHLYEGNDKENFQDRDVLGLNHGLSIMHERKRSITHCPQGHEYTPENTLRNASGRSCRACNNIRRKEKRAGLR